MAKGNTLLAFVATVAIIGAACVGAESSDCIADIPFMDPCLPLLVGYDEYPSPQCCKAFGDVVIANKGRFCLVLNDNSLVGVPINSTKVFTLPQACSVLPLFFPANNSEGRAVA